MAKFAHHMATGGTSRTAKVMRANRMYLSNQESRSHSLNDDLKRARRMHTNSSIRYLPDSWGLAPRRPQADLLLSVSHFHMAVEKAHKCLQ